MRQDAGLQQLYVNCLVHAAIKLKLSLQKRKLCTTTPKGLGIIAYLGPDTQIITFVTGRTTFIELVVYKQSVCQHGKFHVAHL